MKGFFGGSVVKNLSAMQETLGQEDPLEKEMAIHSSILVWKSHGQKSQAGCSPWGWQRVGRDLAKSWNEC